MSNIASKTKPKIEKVIKKFPTEAVVTRDIRNDLGEPEDEEEICVLTGFYHEEKTRVIMTVADKGQYLSNKSTKTPYLMVVYDEVSRRILEGDYLTIGVSRYMIRDLGNANNMDIYFDLQLERMSGYGV